MSVYAASKVAKKENLAIVKEGKSKRKWFSLIIKGAVTGKDEQAQQISDAYDQARPEAVVEGAGRWMAEEQWNGYVVALLNLIDQL